MLCSSSPLDASGTQLYAYYSLHEGIHDVRPLIELSNGFKSDPKVKKETNQLISDYITLVRCLLNQGRVYIS